MTEDTEETEKSESIGVTETLDEEDFVPLEDVTEDEEDSDETEEENDSDPSAGVYFSQGD